MSILRSSTYKYQYDFKGYDVARIVFYNDNGIVASTERGFVQPLHDLTDPTSYDNADRFGFEISGEPRLRNKVNLTRKEHFFIKVVGGLSGYGDTEVILYLYVGEESDIHLKLHSQVKKKSGLSKSNNMITTYDILQLYGKYLIEPVYIASQTSSKVTTTNVGKQVQKIEEIMKEKNEVCPTSYELERLLKYFDITEKN